MKSRRTVDEKLKFQIKFGETHKTDIKWGELIKIEGILPTDTVLDIHFEESLESGFKSMSCEDDRKTLYTPFVLVMRPREENDSEYFIRMKDEQHEDEVRERREKNEYLRLKAKYEK